MNTVSQLLFVFAKNPAAFAIYCKCTSISCNTWQQNYKFTERFTNKIKHAIKHKTSPARLAQLLQPSLFCFSLQPMTAYRPGLDGMPSLAAS